MNSDQPQDFQFKEHIPTSLLQAQLEAEIFTDCQSLLQRSFISLLLTFTLSVHSSLHASQIHYASSSSPPHGHKDCNSQRAHLFKVKKANHLKSDETEGQVAYHYQRSKPATYGKIQARRQAEKALWVFSYRN